MENMMSMALEERGDGGACAAGRMPTNRWPVYSMTREVTILAGETTADMDPLEAERDYLLTGLSVRRAPGGPVQAPLATIRLSYCNIAILDRVDVQTFGPCCARKPIFLQQVRENKDLKGSISLPAGPLLVDVTFLVTFSGFQGKGCCGS